MARAYSTPRDFGLEIDTMQQTHSLLPTAQHAGKQHYSPCRNQPPHTFTNRPTFEL
jgi:hypothetical protein